MISKSSEEIPNPYIYIYIILDIEIYNKVKTALFQDKLKGSIKLPRISPQQHFYQKRVPSKYLDHFSTLKAMNETKSKNINSSHSNNKKYRMHKSSFRPTNCTGSINLLERKIFLDDNTNVELFVNKGNKEQLNVLKNYLHYAPIIHKEDRKSVV